MKKVQEVKKRKVKEDVQSELYSATFKMSKHVPNPTLRTIFNLKHKQQHKPYPQNPSYKSLAKFYGLKACRASACPNRSSKSFQKPQTRRMPKA
jgi:hypothetical protein